MTFPKLAAAVFSAYQAGDAEEGNRLYDQLMATRRIIEKAGHPAIVSYGVLREIGIDVGEARLPWREPAPTAIDEVVRELEPYLKD